MKPYRIIIAGGRNFNDFDYLARQVDYCTQKLTKFEIVSGTARGADELGEEYAKAVNMPIKRFPADWGRYGKSAGYRRNAEMADYADALIVFWDGESRGTGHMIDLAKQKGLNVRVYKY